MMNITLIACNKDRTTGKPSCAGRGSEALITQLEEAINKADLPVSVDRVRCLGECLKGPNMRIAPGGSFYYGVSEETLPTILADLKAALEKSAIAPAP
ncbi:MAG: (2Fe-2S) ferredoxin domain-containing protein [Magnetococcales bacterium]|nr:(2Fe-2S) ferredoxin domain-containing protein [Magnetococcales bacterium]